MSLTATCNPIYNLGLRRNDHLPPNQAVTKPKIELSKCNYVKSERINRYVPTPGGITLGPQTFNPKRDVEHRDKDNMYFPGHMSDTKTTARAPVSWGGRPAVGSLRLERLDLTSDMMFPALSGFPGRDIRTGNHEEIRKRSWFYYSNVDVFGTSLFFLYCGHQSGRYSI